MEKPKAKKKRIQIVAPATKEGEREFEVIGTYWFTTYPSQNPFIGSPRCTMCRLPACFERLAGELYGAVTITEFACPQGHRWEHRVTHD